LASFRGSARTAAVKDLKRARRRLSCLSCLSCRPTPHHNRNLKSLSYMPPTNTNTTQPLLLPPLSLLLPSVEVLASAATGADSRDALLGGSSLALVVLADKASVLLLDGVRLGASVKAMKSQALGASAAAKKAMAEVDEKMGKVEKVEKAKKTGGGDGGDGGRGTTKKAAEEEEEEAVLVGAAREVAAAEAKELRGRCAKAEADRAAMEAQAKNQGEEMMRLMDENARLGKKLEDFEILMGDQMKKLA
jgi:hypothetical protein